MKIIEEIGVRLSQEKFRKLYLVLFIILLAAIAIPLLLKDINYNITDILDYIELLFVLLTLLYLYSSTDKQELNRYKENYKFYKNRYKGHSLLKLETSKSTIYSSSINYTQIDISKAKDLNKIKFTLEDCEYTLPSLIQDRARDILIEKFNIQSKTDYNGLTLSLKNIYLLEDGSIELKFCRSCYYDYLLTNMIPEYEILPNLTVREYLESSSKKTLNNLNVSLAENHLGISSLVEIPLLENNKTANYLVIPKRSQKTTVFKGQLAPSISGAANIDTCSNDGDISIKNFFGQEIEEEIYPLFKELYNIELYKMFKDDFLNNAAFAGISRELKRLGKPELFFYYRFSRPAELKDILENKSLEVKIEKNYIEVIIKNENKKDIDLNESDSFLLIKPEKFIEQLKYYTNKHSKSKSAYEKEEIYTVFEKNTLKVSESLFVNTIYAKKYFNSSPL